jgi:hypothetical protein
MGREPVVQLLPDNDVIRLIIKGAGYWHDMTRTHFSYEYHSGNAKFTRNDCGATPF